MKIRKNLALAVGLLLAGVSGAFALRGTANPALPPVPAEPARATVRVLEIHPFELGEAVTHWYRAERPQYERGWLLVLEAPRELLVARQTAEPVLQVGPETAERVNVGADSGRLVAIVPDLGDVDVATAPVFFGEPELPERITREAAREALARAVALGVRAEPGRDGLLREPVTLPDGYELHYWAATLVARHSPQEVDLIRGLQAPRLR